MTKVPADILARAKQLESDSPRSMVAIFAPTGDYLYASQSHRSLLGYTPNELIGKNLMRDIIDPQDLPHTQLAFMDAILHGKSVVIGVNLRHRSGEVSHVRAEAWYIAEPETSQAWLLGRATPAGSDSQ